MAADMGQARNRKRQAPKGRGAAVAPTGRAATPGKGRRPVVGRRRTVTPWLLGAVAVAVIALAAFGVTQATGGSGGGTASPTPAPNAPLASLAGQASGQPVDGIECQADEGAVLHIHAHLAVYVDGAQRTIPAGVGIPNPQIRQGTAGPYASASTCLYWLHIHTADGIVHVESPTRRSFTLGQLFDIWNQPLSATAVGPAHGALIVYVNGKRSSGDPRAITLGANTVVQIDVGKDVAPQPFRFPAGL
jgi:hypothetical protein